MTLMYRHTQIGWPLLCVLLVAAGNVVWRAISHRAPNVESFGFFIAFVLAMVAILFTSLTIEVTSDELIWFFGPGFWRKRVALADIASATQARNKWWWGWGIRLAPRGWLYNVGGLDAVEIALKNGKTFRLGTDDASALAARLSQAR